MSRSFNIAANAEDAFKKNDIKLIICYLLSNIDAGLKKDDIVSVLSKCSVANYFEITNAFSELITQKHISSSLDDTELFFITDTGKTISEQLSVSLPYSLREKVISQTLKLLSKTKRETENSVNIKNCENGYIVECNISGTNIDLLTLSIYAPDLMQAELIKESFLKKPEKFYQAVLSLIPLEE